jgi:hypothetical protein
MRFGKSFIRGFGWGLGRQSAWEATHPRPKKQKRRSKTAQVFSNPAPQLDWRVYDWIMEAVEYYKTQGRTDPTFEEIRAHVYQHHNYTLTR